LGGASAFPCRKDFPVQSRRGGLKGEERGRRRWAIPANGFHPAVMSDCPRRHTQPGRRRPRPAPPARRDPSAASTARHGPHLLVRLRVRPGRHRAQSCAIASGLAASMRSPWCAHQIFSGCVHQTFPVGALVARGCSSHGLSRGPAMRAESSMRPPVCERGGGEINALHSKQLLMMMMIDDHDG
jgi:hypothetical protein